MAEEEKKPKVKAGAMVTLLNRGKRHFDLAGGRVSPNETVTVSSDEAAKLMAWYPQEMLDISKLPAKGVNAEAAKLQKANDELAAENAKLKDQLAAGSGKGK